MKQTTSTRDPALTPADRDAPELPAAAETADRVVRVLPNRMVVVVQKVSTAPVVSAQVWVKTGSLYEQEHVGAGLSHFLEHLLSGGTTSTRPEADSNAELGRMGAQTNAATSLDTVRYYINTTADEAPAAIDLLSDWMQSNLVLESEYTREREVIQREFSMGDGDPNRILWKLTQQARFAATPDHPGIHPTIGYLDEFLSISRDELEAFYKRMYVPNNMVFVVAGDVDPAATADRIASLWGDVPAAGLPTLAFPVEPDEAEPTDVTGYAAVARPKVRMFWRGVRLASEHDYALDLAASVLGSGDASRLVKKLRDERQLVTSIDAYNYSTAWGRGFFGVDFEPAEGADLGEVKEAVLAEVDALRAGTIPVTDAELARAKRKVLVSVAAAGQSADALAGRIASDVISLGDPDHLRRYGEAIQSVRPAALAAAAGAVLPPAGVSTVTLLPADEENPVSTFGRLAASSGHAEPREEAFDLDNARVVSELAGTLAADAGEREPVTLGEQQTRTLSNGLTVIARRNTLVPVVSMQLFTLGGLLADEPGREGVGNAAWSMLDRGAAGRSAEQIAEFLEDRGASLATASGNNTDYVTARALAEDWKPVMETMADVALRPDFPADQWDKVRPRLLAAIDRQTDSWHGELRDRFRHAYYGDHPWSETPRGVAEVVEGLTVEALAAEHAARLDPARSVLSVVGDAEPDAVFAEAERLFGGFASTSGTAFDPPDPGPAPSGLEVFETDKPVTAVQIGYGPGITRDDPDYAAMQVLTRLLSSFPSGRLEQALRGEGPGLVYASQAGNVVGVVPGFFAVLFNTSADTAVEATSRAAAVVENARASLASDDELARAKARVLADEAFGQQSNAQLAAGAALDKLYRVSDPDGSKLRAAVEALTPEDLRDVAQRRLGSAFAAVLTQDPVDGAALRAALGVAAAATGSAVPPQPMGAPEPAPVFEK
ncbi:peptidase M16 family protein [Phycisphaera mikurensis NBRC 102666]|uniref:Peptidase M16 family protein n=2 Tax=Phycisphaera TaxID=666508 RepID=I0ID03_PHYMF|nr:peptidase M16 family protein [Phycisphaera mikurensis NBRC 102666]